MIFAKGKNFDLRIEENDEHTKDFVDILNNIYISEGSQLGRLPILEPKKNDINNLICAITADTGGTFSVIGRVSLEDINYFNRSTELKIFVKKAWQKKGIAKGACAIMIDHAFSQLGLNRIYAGTLETNEGFMKLAEGLGMAKEGQRVKAVYKNNKFVDVIEYGLLKVEDKADEDQSQV